MKATGMIRRIDDLGRIVIPKELRRTYHIREGDPLELYVDAEGICLRKYSSMGTILPNASACARALQQNFGATVLVCDTDMVLASTSNMAGKLNKPISEALSLTIRKGKEYFAPEQGDVLQTFLKDNGKHSVRLVVPVKNMGEVCGGVIILDESSSDVPLDILMRGARMAAALMTERLEV